MRCKKAQEHYFKNRDGMLDELNGRLSQIWLFLLPGVAAEPSLPYFRQFLAREAMRHTRPGAPASAAEST